MISATHKTSKRLPPGVRYEVCEVGDLSDDLLARLVHSFEEEFGYLERVWPKSEWYILAWKGSVLVGQCGLLRRAVKVGCQEVAVSGVHGLITQPLHRRRGVGTAVMRVLEAFTASELRLEFSMLHCATPLVPFYLQLGWQLIDVPVMFDQPGGKDCQPPANMILKCGHTEWPDGPVDLCGYPW